MLNKVPEVTIWFWVIKILCTTVGESFADWINMTLGVGLVNTAIIFTVVLRRRPGGADAAAPLRAVRLLADRRRRQRHRHALHRHPHRPARRAAVRSAPRSSRCSSPSVFGIWYARERTLSIHSIVTTPREAFYWLAVLVTFALGTATGDWTLELTGWGPGKSVLLPAGLIVAVVDRLASRRQRRCCRFWLAYILTRPLGANIGDWLALPTEREGPRPRAPSSPASSSSAPSWSPSSTSRSPGRDVIEKPEADETPPHRRPARAKRICSATTRSVAVATGGLLV